MPIATPETKTPTKSDPYEGVERPEHQFRIGTACFATADATSEEQDEHAQEGWSGSAHGETLSRRSARDVGSMRRVRL
jgi:hypothetical protein